MYMFMELWFTSDSHKYHRRYDISDYVDISRMLENNEINILSNRQQYVFDKIK